VQFACENISDGWLENIYENSEFLKGFKNEIQHKTNGCIFMEDPKWLKELASKYCALNTSNRASYLVDLEHAPEVISHGSCPVIPEKNLLYRLAKRTAFFGMGAYG